MTTSEIAPVKHEINSVPEGIDLQVFGKRRYIVKIMQITFVALIAFALWATREASAQQPWVISGFEGTLEVDPAGCLIKGFDGKSLKDIFVNIENEMILPKGTLLSAYGCHESE